jgi:hypothetical protein
MENKEIESPEHKLEVEVKNPIPIGKEQLAGFLETRKLTKRGRETVKVHDNQIKFREGHNARTFYDPEKLEALADSIIALGGIQEPIMGDLLHDGTLIVLKGHRRVLANRIAIARGGKVAHLQMVEAFLTPKSFNEIDRTIAMMLENLKEEVDMKGQAESILQLKGYGLSNADIAKKLPGLNEMQISLRLTYAGLSKEEQKLIEDGKISPTAAVKLARKVSDPAKRIEVIEKAAAGEDGKLKVTEVDNIISDQEQADNIASMMMGNAANGETGDPFANDRADYLQIHSGDKNDPSMKGTSPHASESTQDPAIKSKDQPKPLDEDNRDDQDLITGKATARDMIGECYELCKKLSNEIEKDLSPKGITLLFDLEKKLLDLKAILKSK